MEDLCGCGIHSLDLKPFRPYQIEAIYDYAIKAHQNGAKWMERHSDPLMAEVEDLNQEELMAAHRKFAEILHRGLGLPEPDDHLNTRPTRILKAVVGWQSKVERYRRKGWKNLSYWEMMDLVDLAVNHAYPKTTQDEIAQRLAARNFYAGKIANIMTPEPGDANLLPDRVRAIPTDLLNRTEKELVDYSHANAMNLVQGVAEDTRQSYRKLLMDHRKSRATTKDLEASLFERHADQNSDMRRIAVTETAASSMNSLVASYKTGSKVRWMALPGACKYCEGMNGRIITVVAPSNGQEDWQNTIYVGKTNYNRSFSPTKITPEGMKPREPDEMAGPACPAHPNCRCTLLDVVDETTPSPSSTRPRQSFAERLAQHRAARKPIR